MSPPEPDLKIFPDPGSSEEPHPKGSFYSIFCEKIVVNIP